MAKTFIALLLLLTLSGVQAADSGSSDMLSLDLEALVSVQLTSTIASGLHHTHPKGEWMVGYTFKRMAMDGNRDGTRRVSDAEVVDPTGFGFMVTPTRMDMDMHMFGLMYGYTDDLTIMAMVPYKRMSMDHVTRTGVRFTTSSEGFGDLSLTGLYTFWRSDPHRLHFTAGLSLPSGSIDEKDVTPASGGVDVQLPYPMQLGSGTVDLLVGLTYLGVDEQWSWGANSMGTFRLGDNDNNYALGDRFVADLWASRKWSSKVSTPFRLHLENWGNIDGADPILVPAMVPTADPNRRAGTRIDVSLGVNHYFPDGRLQGNRVAIEYLLPVYQSLDGPQLEIDSQLSITWQWAY